MSDPWEPVRRALLGLRRHETRGFGRARAAVLVPLFERDGQLEVLLIRRPDDSRSHAGQVACPGGKIDGEETAREAALREAKEELGIDPERVDVLGALHDVDTTTGFVITPWVGKLEPGVVDALAPHAPEVARVFSAPLDALADPERSQLEIRPWNLAGRPWDIPFFRWDGEVIWGATGRLLLDLLDLLWPERKLRERRANP